MSLLIQNFVANNFIRSATYGEKNEPNYAICPELVFSYIDYLEYKHSLENSLSTKKWAVASIILTGAIGLLQIIFGFEKIQDWFSSFFKIW